MITTHAAPSPPWKLMMRGATRLRRMQAAFQVVVVVGTLLLASGCLARRPVIYQDMASQTNPTPRTIAILPFDDLTGTPDLPRMLRESFYGHLSHRPFRDVELDVIDRVLGDAANAAFTTPEALQEMGGRLGCDAVVIGTVIEFERLFMGIYSQLSVGADIAIYDTHDGRRLWHDRHTTRLHDGGLPLTPLGIPISGARSGWNLRNSQIVRAVDDLARTLASRIPDPGRPSPPAAAWHFDLQVGAYLDHQRALDQRDDLVKQGFPAAVHSEMQRQAVWHRVMVGPYDDEGEALRVQRQLEAELGNRPFIRRRPL